MPHPRPRRYGVLALVTATLAGAGAALAGCDPAVRPEPPDRSSPVGPSANRRLLTDALLTPADVPPGYRPAARPTSTEEYESEPAECGARFDALEVDVASGPGVEEARVVFATPGDFSRVQHIIRRYDDRVREALTTALDTVRECRRFVLTYSGSTQFEVTTEVVRSTEDGFDAAVHLRAAAFPVEERLLVRAVGDSLVIISHAGPEPPDPAVADGLMATAVERLRNR